MWLQFRCVEVPPDHPIGQKIDERIGLRVQVVAVEHHLGVLEHLAQPPGQRLRVGGQVGMGAQGVEVDAVGLAGGEVADLLERLRLESQASVGGDVVDRQLGGLIEEAEVGALHVEAERRHRTLVRREGLEDAREEELHRARLGRQARDTGDVEVRRLGAEQEVGVEVDGRGEPRRAVGPHRHPRGAVARRVGVHPQRGADIVVGGHAHLAEGHRLQRFLGLLPEDGGGVEPDLGAGRAGS